MDWLRFLNDDVITPATATKTTATPWCSHIPSSQLQDQPSHLNLENGHLDATLAAAHIPTPSHGVTYTDLSIQVISWSYCEAAVGPDLDLSQENFKKLKKSPNIRKRILEIPSSLPMVISQTPPCMLLLWPSPSVLVEKRHS